MTRISSDSRPEVDATWRPRYTVTGLLAVTTVVALASAAWAQFGSHISLFTGVRIYLLLYLFAPVIALIVGPANPWLAAHLRSTVAVWVLIGAFLQLVVVVLWMGPSAEGPMFLLLFTILIWLPQWIVYDVSKRVVRWMLAKERTELIIRPTIADRATDDRRRRPESTARWRSG